MNVVTLAGRLTAEPELKTTNTGTEVMNFTLAVNRRFAKQGETETDFISCVAWAKTAAFIHSYFHKGDGINLVGRLESRKWVDSNGQNRISWEVIADNVEFPLSKKSTTAPTQTQTQTYTAQQTQQTQPAQNTFDVNELLDDEDMPF